MNSNQTKALEQMDKRLGDFKGELNHVHIEIGGLRAEVSNLRSDLEGRIDSLRTEMNRRIDHLWSSMLLLFIPMWVIIIGSIIALFFKIK